MILQLLKFPSIFHKIANSAFYTPPTLQPIWDLRLGHEDLLQSPLWPVVLSVTFYFTLCLPFMLADLFCQNQSWYLKYKIQPDKKVRKPFV